LVTDEIIYGLRGMWNSLNSQPQ